MNDYFEVEGCRVYWDKSSGQGHCWVLADRHSLPVMVRDEITCEIMESGRTKCADYKASNGEHYRWSPQ